MGFYTSTSEDSTVIDRENVRSTGEVGVALDAVEAGIRAARPGTVLEECLTVEDGILTVGDTPYDLASYDEVLVVGGGNAAGRIASHLSTVLGSTVAEGIVVTDDPDPGAGVEVVEGTHPVPSDANREGTRRLLDRARAADEDTLAVAGVTRGARAPPAPPAPPPRPAAPRAPAGPPLF